MKFKLMLTVAVIILATAACKKSVKDEVVIPPTTPNPSPAKVAPDGFNWTTSKQVNVDVRLLSNNNEALQGVRLSLFAPGKLAAGDEIFQAISDNSGYVRGTVTIPSYIDTLIIDPAYVGLPRKVKGFFTGGNLTGTIGGANGSSGNIAGRSYNQNNGRNYFDARIYAGVFYKYMGTYDNAGKPSYLDPIPDVISAGLLSRVNASLPERNDLPSSSPSFFSSNVNLNLNVSQTADVWVTFVSEGAGYKNTLGYYKYNTNTPPSSPTAIDTIFYIYPNASFSTDGGGLKSGDRVKLGNFTAGTTISFVLLANAWSDNDRKVNETATKYYSRQSFNSGEESITSKYQHGVQLYDATENLYLFGFEDLNRSSGGSDDDFNDLVFYTKANPVSAIGGGTIPPVVVPVDSDNDGVPNTVDDFPTDPTKAYITYYPSKSTFATLAFEDLWPSVGDYDMNDMLIRQRFTYISNAQNNVVEFKADVALGAAGASFKNGYAIEMPVSATAIASVTGHSITGSYITLNTNGTEKTTGTSQNAIIVPFDNHRNILSDPSGAVFLNTVMANAKIASDTVRMVVKFTTPPALATMSYAAFNPFLIKDAVRGTEIHLPGYKPTVMATNSLFGTWSDATNIAANKYYLTATNWPWAISFVGNFIHPIEQASITEAYPNFLTWAQSGGLTLTDWYSNTAASYRKTSLLYTK